LPPATPREQAGQCQRNERAPGSSRIAPHHALILGHDTVTARIETKAPLRNWQYNRTFRGVKTRRVFSNPPALACQ
jgi:hypothetical protein